MIGGYAVRLAEAADNVVEIMTIVLNINQGLYAAPKLKYLYLYVMGVSQIRQVFVGQELVLLQEESQKITFVEVKKINAPPAFIAIAVSWIIDADLKTGNSQV